MSYPKLILASASPRRREILTNAGLEYETLATDVDETPRPGERPESLVRRLAAEKLEAACNRIQSQTHRPELQHMPVLAADTIVAIAGEILGKPASREDARRMLKLLSGNVHEVLTGVALRTGATNSTPDVQVSLTRVSFRPLTSRQLDDYLDSGEPFDKAGAYGIQGLASKFVERIDGCYFNVVGLPVALVCAMLERHFDCG